MIGCKHSLLVPSHCLRLDEMSSREMLALIQSHLEDEVSRKALKDAFEDVLFSLEGGDIVNPLQIAKYLIAVYKKKPKKVPIIPGELVRN